MIVTNMSFILADERLRATGLLGWVKVTLANAVIVDGITLRRTAAGHLALTWPRKPNGHPVATPVNSEARTKIEAAIRKAVAAHLEAQT